MRKLMICITGLLFWAQITFGQTSTIEGNKIYLTAHEDAHISFWDNDYCEVTHKPGEVITTVTEGAVYQKLAGSLHIKMPSTNAELHIFGHGTFTFVGDVDTLNIHVRKRSFCTINAKKLDIKHLILEANGEGSLYFGNVISVDIDNNHLGGGVVDINSEQDVKKFECNTSGDQIILIKARIAKANIWASEKGQVNTTGRIGIANCTTYGDATIYVDKVLGFTGYSHASSTIQVDCVYDIFEQRVHDNSKIRFEKKECQ